MKNKIIIVKKPVLKNPYLICAWPGMGDVAFKAAKFLVDNLKAEEFASLDGSEFYYPSGIKISHGILKLNEIPFSKFYFYKNKLKGRDLIIFLSNAQPDFSKYQEYTSLIFSFVAQFKPGLVLSFAALPSPIEHIQKPALHIAATSEKVIRYFKKYEFNLLKNNQISGMNGMIIGVAKQKGIDGACILAEIPFYMSNISNPRASMVIVEALKGVIKFNVEIHSLQEESKVIEREVNKIIDYLKSTIQPDPISEDEIELIKDLLSKQTRVPDSINTRIESLFKLAQKDNFKAEELKGLLDKWNVYKQYEDRFLDLFKKFEQKDIH